MGNVIILISLFLLAQRSNSLTTDITGTTFELASNEQIAAFGDFNADKLTDVFTISNDGHTIGLFLATKDGSYNRRDLLRDSTSKFTSVVPADFDGDTQMDLFLTTQESGTSSTKVKGIVYWGTTSGKIDNDNSLKVGEEFNDQPMILDVNGDMIPDLLGENATGTRMYWIFLKNEKNYTQEVVSSQLMPSLVQPINGAFVDLNNDMATDLCVMSGSAADRQLEMWFNVNGELTRSKNISLAEFKDMKVIGQAMFADLGNQDSRIDILLPVCADDQCTQSYLYVYTSDKWQKLDLNFQSGGHTWGFVPPNSNPADTGLIPITLRTGDFNLNGFQDIICVLQTLNDDKNITQRAFIMENVECEGCGTVKRTFQIKFGISLHSVAEKALLPAFFDHKEDGILDVILSTYSTDKKSHIHLLQHKFTEDAYFLKVKVVSGLCYGNCPGNREPYGVNQYGPVIKYTTQDLHGNTISGIATQLSQSAYTPLQLPFTVFGLGQMPNFVDSLDVGIPHPKGTGVRSKTWMSIVPNSQLIVIPYPNNKPNSWKNKLFVTPSRMVMITGATLLGTCGFIAGIVGILHWREKVEDKKEKLQEAHKFHFDAM